MRPNKKLLTSICWKIRYKKENDKQLDFGKLKGHPDTIAKINEARASIWYIEAEIASLFTEEQAGELFYRYKSDRSDEQLFNILFKLQIENIKKHHYFNPDDTLLSLEIMAWNEDTLELFIKKVEKKYQLSLQD